MHTQRLCNAYTNKNSIKETEQRFHGVMDCVNIEANTHLMSRWDNIPVNTFNYCKDNTIESKKKAYY